MELNIPRPKKKYETIIILHPETSEEEQKKLFNKNKEIINSYEGDFHHVDSWGKRKMGNWVGKIRMGQYFHATFDAKSECIAELERTMKINDRVLKCFHLKLDDRTTLPAHVEAYRDVINKSIEKEKEKDAKIAKKQMARQARSSRD